MNRGGITLIYKSTVLSREANYGLYGLLRTNLPLGNRDGVDYKLAFYYLEISLMLKRTTSDLFHYLII